MNWCLGLENLIVLTLVFMSCAASFVGSVPFVSWGLPAGVRLKEPRSF